MTRARDLSQVLNDVGSISTNDIANGAVTQVKLDPSISLGVRVSSVAYPGDDTAADTAGGQTITINGAGFAATPTVYIDNTIAPSVSFVSSTQITFTTPAKTAGTYNLFVINPDGSTAIHVMGISYSGTPTWTTPAGSLGTQNAAAISVQLIATGDTPLVYSLTSGSTLPAGVTLSSSGLISGTLGTAQTFSFSVDVTDPQYQTTPRSFSLTVSVGEPYFQYVTLLLSGNQPSGVTDTDNKTFKDSSANNFTISRAGNTTQGTFTPFSKVDGRWGMYYGGAGYETWTTATNYSGTDITIECWVYAVAATTSFTSLVSSNSGTGNYNQYFNLAIDGSNRLACNVYGASNTALNNTSTIPLNQWVHCAFVLTSGGTLSLYQNGTRVATTTGASIASVTTNIQIGGIVQTSGGTYVSYFNGYISNARINRSAVYSGASFSVPTSPLTNNPNTNLLVCQSSRVKDNSGNNYTASSAIPVTTFSPFPALTAYAAGTNGGSGYFDGSGDYLNIANNNAFAFGTGNFTVECWVYPTSFTFGTADVILSTYQNGTVGWTIAIGFTGGTFYCATAGDTQIIASSVAPRQQWFHLAMVRSGTTLAFFVNGVRAGTLTDSTNITSTTELSIGTNTGGGALNFIGYMSGARIVKGTAVYDPTQTTLTIPTAPLTAITNTSLLLNYTNGAIIDSSMANDLETAGNAQISTAQSKWGGSSIYFDGTGDALIVPNSQNFDFGSGDFTVEVWIYPTASGAYKGIFTKRESAANYSPVQVLINSGTMALFVSTSGSSWAINTNASSSPALNTWSHIAVCRYGGTITLYLNGASVASGSVSTSSLMTNTARFVFGSESATDSGNYAGYMQDARVTKGIARYTANFTPPTGPFLGNGV